MRLNFTPKAQPSSSDASSKWVTSAPLLSVALLSITLFVVAMSKMHVRHMGYEVVKLAKDKRLLRDELKTRTLSFTRLLRPDRVEKMASVELELARATQGQVIHMGHQRVVFKR